MIRVRIILYCSLARIFVSSNGSTGDDSSTWRRITRNSGGGGVALAAGTGAAGAGTAANGAGEGAGFGTFSLASPRPGKTASAASPSEYFNASNILLIMFRS